MTQCRSHTTCTPDVAPPRWGIALTDLYIISHMALTIFNRPFKLTNSTFSRPPKLNLAKNVSYTYILCNCQFSALLLQGIRSFGTDSDVPVRRNNHDYLSRSKLDTFTFITRKRLTIECGNFTNEPKIRSLIVLIFLRSHKALNLSNSDKIKLRNLDGSRCYGDAQTNQRQTGSRFVSVFTNSQENTVISL